MAQPRSQGFSLKQMGGENPWGRGWTTVDCRYYGHPRRAGGGDLVSLIAGYERKTKFLCTCKSHRHCSFNNYLRILAMDRKRLKIRL